MLALSPPNFAPIPKLTNNDVEIRLGAVGRITRRFDCLRHKSPSSPVWNLYQCGCRKNRASSDEICLDVMAW
ncbi:hypothetical protein LA080_000632 [Diaporthe eres]|nr:hypothetical protein LA080_000632 [Diaporthe eres]